ncbi:MAG: hypothetical protein IBJ04_07375 [Hydrogenophaga sp.]|uniref:hypothetical protein n=1 Tax=Hydrogenophaga sp. TaxID=1904254 RepID=UPI002579A95E|nr:hypothetical protein [Hydrogenophaga sp.]MBL0944128.1 hypothetical protein [Hydrogenophaga sp.]
MTSRLTNPVKLLQARVAASQQRAQDKRTIADETKGTGERLQALDRYLQNTGKYKVLVLRTDRHGEARLSTRRASWIDRHLIPTNVEERRISGLNHMLENLFVKVSSETLLPQMRKAVTPLVDMFKKDMGQEAVSSATTFTLREKVKELARAYELTSVSRQQPTAATGQLQSVGATRITLDELPPTA